MENSNKENGVVYSKEIQYAIEKIGLLSSDMNNPSYFTLCNDIISVIYDHYHDVEISRSTYRLVWRMLNHIVVAGNFVWFKQYWSWAVQYEMFKYSGNKQSESYRQFYLFHVMVGALLCFNKRYEWLSFILFYTNKQPESFGLIPNTFQEITDVTERVYYMSDYPPFFENDFPLAGVADGARNNSIIAGVAYEYLALLFIRLWSLDYNVSYAEPLTMPYLDTNNIERNENFANMAGILKVKVKGWYDKNRINEIELRELPEINEAISKLEDFVKLIDEKNKYIYENAEPDQEKLQMLNEDIRNSALRSASYFTMKDVSELADKDVIAKNYLLRIDYLIEKSVLIKERSISYTNLPGVLIRNLRNQAIAYYELVFANSRAKQTYKIKYDDIGDAIRKLRLNDEYVILSFGEYFSEKLDISNPIINVDSRMSCILVLKKDQLPFVEYDKIQQIEDGLEEIIAENVHLYSNVNHLSKDIPLQLRQNMVIYSPKDGIEFIRLNVDHYSLSQTFDLDDIKPVSE